MPKTFDLDYITNKPSNKNHKKILVISGFVSVKSLPTFFSFRRVVVITDTSYLVFEVKFINIIIGRGNSVRSPVVTSVTLSPLIVGLYFTVYCMGIRFSAHIVFESQCGSQLTSSCVELQLDILTLCGGGGPKKIRNYEKFFGFCFLVILVHLLHG